MGDSTADGGLIDVSGLSLNELLEEADESSFAQALQRISGDESVDQNGFSNFI